MILTDREILIALKEKQVVIESRAGFIGRSFVDNN